MRESTVGPLLRLPAPPSPEARSVAPWYRTRPAACRSMRESNRPAKLRLLHPKPFTEEDQWSLSSVIGCYMSSLACNQSTRLNASRCSRPGKVNLCGERHQGKSSGRKSSKVACSSKQNVVVVAPWSDWMVLVVSCQYPSEL